MCVKILHVMNVCVDALGTRTVPMVRSPLCVVENQDIFTYVIGPNPPYYIFMCHMYILLNGVVMVIRCTYKTQLVSYCNRLLAGPCMYSL